MPRIDINTPVEEIETLSSVTTYELTIGEVNLVYLHGNKFVTFNEHEILIVKHNGIEKTRYVGNDAIFSFLKSVNAKVANFLQPTPLTLSIEIDKINIPTYDIFFKDERVDISFVFNAIDIVDGKETFVVKRITNKVNVSYYDCKVSENISTSENPLELYLHDYTIADSQFSVDIEYHYNANGVSNIRSVADYTMSLTKRTFSADDEELTSSPYVNILTIFTEQWGAYTYEYPFSVYFLTEEPQEPVIPPEEVRPTPDNDGIISIEINGLEYGASLKDGEHLKAKVTYENGSSEELPFKFNLIGYYYETIITPNNVEELPEIFSITLFYDYVINQKPVRVEKTKTMPRPTFKAPAFNGFETNVSSNTYVLQNYSKITLKVALVYDIYNGRKSYKKDLSIDVALGEGKFTATNSNFNIDYFNGNKVIDKSPNEYTITITANDLFGGDNRTTNFKLIVKDFASVIRWEIIWKNPYTIGERLLNEYETKAVLFYNDNEKVEVALSTLVDGGLFTTIPNKNYQFVREENGKSIQVFLNKEDGSISSKTYYLDITSGTIHSYTVTKQLVAVFVPKVVLGVETKNEKEVEDSIYDVWALVDKDVVEPTDSGNWVLLPNKYSFNEKEGISYISYKDNWFHGYLENVNPIDKTTSSKVVFIRDFKHPKVPVDNAIVKFPCYVEGNADKINKATFGILFGSGNYNNRLFVSGNSDYPNIDWHTSDITGAYNDEVDNESVNNLTYFTDLSEQSYGSSDNKVIGYDIVSDDKLIVLKSKSDKEKTIYFRTPTYKEEDNGLVNEVFTTIKGNNSVSGVNPHSIINFNGDTLFVDSDNTIQGLDLTGIVGDTQRYANSRSLLIDRALARHDLSNSILWSNQKYLYLTIDNVGTFVTHYKTKGDGQYEWWLVNYDNPTCFIEIGNDVYYGNNKGNFFKVVKDSFVDIHKVFIREGQGLELAKIKPDQEQIVVNNNLLTNVKVGDTFRHYINEEDYKKNIYKQVCSLGHNSDFDLVVNENNEVVVPSELIGKINEKDTYYLNKHSVGGSFVLNTTDNEMYKFGDKYKFKFVYVANTLTNEKEITNRAKLYKGNEVCDLSKLVEANICKRIEGETEIEKVEVGLIKLANTDIVNYGGQDINIPLFKGEICHRDNVQAYYITSPLLSNISYKKTLWQFTLSNDSGLKSELHLGIAKNKMPKNAIEDISYSNDGFNYDEVDYNSIGFEKIDIPRVFTRYKVLPFLDFVCFAFKNESNTNCVLTSMAITYTIPFPQV